MMIAAIGARAGTIGVVLAASACNLDTFGLSAGVTSMTSEVTSGTAVGPTAAEPTSTGASVATGGESSVGTTGGLVDGDPCDPWQPACPAGSKCAAYAADGGLTWNANKCVPAGDGTPGMGCLVVDASTSGMDTCAAGAMCWDVDDNTLTGVCYAQCSGTPKAPSCPPGSACFSTNTGTINLCVATCDPLMSAQCDGVCVYDSVDKQFICLIDASGGTKVGDSCEFINACPPGSMCGDPMRSEKCDPQADGCCLALCDLNQPPGCPIGDLCEAFLGGASPGYEDVGVCVTAP